MPLRLRHRAPRYLDRTLALETGEVTPSGIDLAYNVAPSIGGALVAVRRREVRGGLVVRQLDEVFGGDPFRIGFQSNRKTLEAVCRYSHEQGLSETELAPEDVFVPETWTHQPTPENATTTAKEKR